MSRLLFGVRLRTSHRLYPAHWPESQSFIHRPTRNYEALFATCAEAEDYADTHVPIEANPFGNNYELTLRQGHLLRRYRSPHWITEGNYIQHDGSGLSISELCQTIKEEGYSPPEIAAYCSRSDWKKWWEKTMQHLTVAEKQLLQQQLGLFTSSTNPFHSPYIQITEGQNNEVWIDLVGIHVIPLERFTELIAPYELRPEDRWGNLSPSLYSWWEANRSQMTDAKKEQIWDLVDPFPYEIIEVELV